MSRHIRVVSALPVLALVVAAAVSCSTTTAGLGAPGVPLSASPSITTSDTGSASGATAPSSTDAPSDSSSQAPTLQPSRAAPTTSATSKTASPTPTPTAKASLAPLVYTDAVCNGQTTGTTVQVTLSWTSANANQVWIESAPIASALNNADPKNDGNGNPLGNAAKGSVNVAFDCANSDYYYNITVYNTLNNSKAGINQQIVRK